MEMNSSTVLKQIENLTQRVAQLEDAHAQQQVRLRELEIMYGVALSLSDELDVDKTLDKFREFIHLHFSDIQLFILLSDGTDEQLSVAISDFDFGGDTQNNKIEIQDDFYFQIIDSGTSKYISDSTKVPFDLQLLSKNREFSWYFLPLASQEYYRLGLMALAREGVDTFSNSEKVLFDNVAQLLSSVLNKVFLFYHTKELSITDPLTRLYNRRYLNERLEEEIQRAKRYDKQLTALLVDIDYFKNYNDLYGHLEGDEVLKEMARLFQDNTRHADIVARFGGEEFVILLPEINKENGRIAAEKLRSKIENVKIKGEEALPDGNLTISIGYATYPQDADNVTDLLDLADKALYMSKESGRNRVSHIDDKK